MIHLHCHSSYSFHAGIPSVEELVTRAKDLGCTALALTDTNRMSGLIRFYTACKFAGIKPILGVELTDPRQPEEKLVLLARDTTGYGDICEIITHRQINPDFTFQKEFMSSWEHIVFITHSETLLTFLATTPNKPRLFAELINHSPDTRLQSRRLEHTAKSIGIASIVSNDSYFLDKSDWETHRILTAIGLCSTLSRLNPCEYAPAAAWLKPAQEMERLFPDHADALSATDRIAQECTVEFDIGKWIMPRISVPQGFTPESYLTSVAQQGLTAIYANSPHRNKAQEILNNELQIISKLGYASYFLIIKNLRDWANAHLSHGFRKPHDCTIMRGSAANSITFYVLGASDLDPIKYDLYFQRFLNEDRASPPDADLDFGWDEREEALDYMVKTWGRDRVAITCTTNHFRSRAAFRETAKVFGYTDEQISEIADSHRTHHRAIRDSDIEKIAHYAKSITGKPRFLGQHPGGVLVTNDPIWRHAACEYSGGTKNRLITQIDMHSGIDELGLIKFDLLGNGSLSVLRDCLHQLKDQQYEDPRVDNLDMCYSDPATQTLIKTGNTRGIFYIESPAQMRLNQKAQAATFEEITITSSLVRPAGTSYTATFVERHRKAKMNITDWEYLHPALEPILRETHDVCAFQEDITKICHQVAGLTFKQADKVRKMMNSLHDGILSSAEYQLVSRQFIEGCMQVSGLSHAQALTLWERVASFTGFSFCKSHSASYAQLSFKCAYLKAHYPAHFLAAVISNSHGFYTTSVYINEARRCGAAILPISINESQIRYTGMEEKIRPGFMHVRNLGISAMETIITERNRNGTFSSLIDFVNRAPIGRKNIESLIYVGAFNGMGYSQPESLFLLDGIYGKQNSVTPELALNNLPDPVPKSLSNFTLAQRCMHEHEYLGYMISGNMLEILDLHPCAHNAIPATSIGRHAGKKIKVFGWPVTRRPHRVMRSGKTMLFLTIEDSTGCIDVILWPEVYERYYDEILEGGAPYEIYGTVSEEYGTFTVEAHELRPVAWSPAQIDMTRASERLEKSVHIPMQERLVA